MNILKELTELTKENVITQETAERIRDYYENKSSSSTNRLFIIFGILGAILVGLGVILVIAHNWDELTRGTKTFFAFSSQICHMKQPVFKKENFYFELAK